jgi:PAS domain S-box-containing protein
MKTNVLDKLVSVGYSILDNGTDPSLGRETRKSVQRLILFIIFGIGVNLVCLLLNYFNGLYVSASLNIICILLLTVSYFLNKDGKLAFAKVLGIVTVNFYLFAISYVEGLRAGEQLYYFPFLLALIFVIDLKKNYQELIMTGVITFITTAMIFILAPYVSTVQTINNDQYSSLSSSNLSLSLIITALFTYYILKALEKNEEKILDEKKFTDTIYDTSLDAVFIVDTTTLLITDCNKSAVEVFGFSNKNEIFGSPAKFLLGEKMEEYILLQGKQSFQKNSPWYGNMDFSRKDDTPFFGYVNVVPFIHSNIIYCKISILDITEIKIAEFEILKAKERAERATKVKSRFLSNMSHELRTPLNAIIGTTNLILQEEYLPSQRQSFDVLKYSSEHMMQLVTDILDFSKIEAGKMELENTPFNLKTFLQKVVSSFTSPITKRNLEFKVDIDEHVDIEITGDEMRLNQVLNNLLSNAVKFTDQGTITVTVKTLHRKSHSSDIYFAISDTGIGIAANKVRQVFESFTQADIETTRKFGGTGLGLAISKKIVEKMGGDLLVSSEVGKGSTFHFTLNFKVTKAQKSYVDEHKLKGLSDLDGVKILLAEDNPINMMVAKRFLQKWNAEVAEAENGLQAIELFAKRKFDLLLIDLEMPEMDGAQAVAHIRTSDSEIPILAFTAATYENMKDDLLQKGFTDFVPKPFRPEDLHKKILQYCKPAVPAQK